MKSPLILVIALSVPLSGCTTSKGTASRPQWILDLEAKALDGDAQAAQQLAGHYNTGNFDPVKARYWSAVGAAFGNPVCIHNLGSWLESGLGGEADEEMAIALFKIAAKRGIEASALELQARGVEK